MAGRFQGNRLCGVLGAGVCTAGFVFLLFVALPLVLIAFGAVNMSECPGAPVIPMYLMVLGIWPLLMMAMFARLKLCPGPVGTIWKTGIIILILFSLSWFIFGGYYIYAIYPPNYDRNVTEPSTSSSRTHTPPAPDAGPSFTSENPLNETSTSRDVIDALRKTKQQTRVKAHGSEAPYCDRTLYLLAFWTTTLVLVLAGNALLLTVCLYGFMSCIDVFVKNLTT